jgi:hypothetical protein
MVRATSRALSDAVHDHVSLGVGRSGVGIVRNPSAEGFPPIASISISA